MLLVVGSALLLLYVVSYVMHVACCLFVVVWCWLLSCGCCRVLFALVCVVLCVVCWCCCSISCGVCLLLLLLLCVVVVVVAFDC